MLRFVCLIKMHIKPPGRILGEEPDKYNMLTLFSPLYNLSCECKKKNSEINQYLNRFVI